MNRKIFYIVFFSIALMGLVISYLIFPFYNPLSLMFFYNKEYEKSFERYKTLYEEKHDRSVSVVVPLIWLNLQYANIDRAIEILQEYIAENPTSYDAIDYLGKIFVSADRPYSNLQLLPRTFALQPTLENIREQATLYFFYGETKKQMTALETLIENYRGYQSEYQTLAYLYAKHGENEKSLGIINKLLAAYPLNELEESSVILAVSLFIENNKKQEALTLAENYLRAIPKATIAADLASVFQGKKLFNDALEILNLIAKEHLSDTETLAMKTSILVDEGKTQEAYDLLKSYFQKGTLPSELYENLITFGLTEEKNPRNFEEIIKTGGASNLSDGTLLKVIEKGYKSNLPGLVEALEKSLPSDRIENDPVLEFALRIGKRKPITPNDLDFYLQPTMQELNDTQKLELAKLYYLIRLNSLSKDSLVAIQSYIDIPENQLNDLTSLLVDLDLTDVGLKKVEEAKATLVKPPSQLDALWIALLSSAGQDSQAAEWLQNNLEELDNSSLDLIARAALLKKNPKSALIAANALLKRKNTTRIQRMHAQALVLAGKTEQGLAILREQFNRGSKAVKSAYLYALSEAAKQLPWYLGEFKSYVANELSVPALKPRKKREIGYALIETGLKKEALPVFFELGKNKPFDNPDTQALIALMGTKLGPEQVAWIKSRARLATGKEKVEWVTLLLDVEQYEAILSVITQKDLEDIALADIYLEALVQLREDMAIIAFFERIFERKLDVARLKKYGKIATGEDLAVWAEKIYLRILDEIPADKDALKELGILYFAKGEYCLSKKMFEAYLYQNPNDYLSNYYYGELLKIDCDKKANRFFYAALVQANDAYDPEDALQIELIKAGSLKRLHCVYRAIDIYWKLLLEKPNNKGIRTEFAGLLVDLQYFCLAKYVLFSPIKEEKGKRTGIRERNETMFLGLSKVNYYKESLQIEKAYDYSDWVIDTFPCEPQVYASRASLEYNIGRWRKALEYLCFARSLQPKNEAYYRTSLDIINEQPSFIGSAPEIVVNRRPYVGVEQEYRKTGFLQREDFWRFAANYLITPYNKFDFFFERDRLDVKNFQKINGDLIHFRGFRQRARLNWTYDFLCGGNVSTNLYFSKMLFGSGINARLLDYYGYWRFGADYHEPFWDFVQINVEHGSRDTFYLERTQRITPQVEAFLGASYNHYNLKGFNGAAQSATVRGYLNKALSNHNPIVQFLGEESSVVLSYTLNAEYPFRVRTRLDATGTPFAPLPVPKREEHSLQFVLSKFYCKKLKFQCNAGYLYDRFGLINKVSPIYGASLTYLKRPGINWTLLFDHTQSNQNTADFVNRFLVNVSLFY